MQNFAINNRRGQIAVFAVILTVVIAGFVSVLAGTLLSNARFLRQASENSLGLQLAESGIDKALWCLNHPSVASCTSYTGETQNQGAGSFTVTATTSGNASTLVASGKVNGQTRTIQLQAANQASANASFYYGIQTGAGGVKMYNSSKIIGNLYSAGPVTGVNSATITGDAVLTPGNPTLDQVSDPPTSPLTTKNLGDTNLNTYVAQSFVPAINDKVHSIDLKIAKHCANPCTAFPGTATLYIYTDNSGKPGTNLSGNGQAITISTPRETDPNWYSSWTTQTFAPANPTTNQLQSGLKYWLVLKASGTNASNYWVVVSDTNGQSYTSTTPSLGTALFSTSGTSWSDVCAGGCDIAFGTKMGGVEPTLSMNGGIGGNAYAYKIDSTDIGKDAYYQRLEDTVRANTLGTVETCSLTPPSNSHCHKVTDDQPAQPFPVSDAMIATFEAQATAGGTVNCGGSPDPCSLTSGTTNIGPKVYNGNVTLSNSAIVNLQGVWWIKGNLSMANTSIVQLDKTVYGTTSGVIIADNPTDRIAGSKISFANSANLSGTLESCTGSPKKCSAGKNAGNTCSVTTDCPTGNYIMAISMNSDPVFSTTAIDIANSLSAGILYAPHGKIVLSNTASLVEVTAQMLELNNTATVTYDSGLQSAFFTSGPGGSWQPTPQTWQDLH